MRNANYTTRAKTASGINVVLGAWLVASAWIFVYTTASGAWDSVVVGALIFIFAVTRVSNLVGPMLARVNTVLGLWTIASPWIFGYANGGPAMWNSICTGIVITVLAWSSAVATLAREEQESHLAARQ